MTDPLKLSFDVTAAWDTGEAVRQSAWMFLPDNVSPVGILCCLPGGTYDKHYWHLDVAGHPGYSFAEHLVAQGFVVIAIDHLGVGESSRPADPEDVRLARVARADAAVIEQIRQRSAAGTLHPDIPAWNSLPLFGIGHSMGAALTIIAQAESTVFDARQYWLLVSRSRTSWPTAPCPRAWTRGCPGRRWRCAPSPNPPGTTATS